MLENLKKGAISNYLRDGVRFKKRSRKLFGILHFYIGGKC